MTAFPLLILDNDTFNICVPSYTVLCTIPIFSVILVSPAVSFTVGKPGIEV